MPQKGLLYHLLPAEATPPQSVWNNISKVMDDEATVSVNPEFSDDLLQGEDGFGNNTAKINIDGIPVAFSAGPLLAAMEEVPPAFVWQNIRQELDRDAVIPMRPVNKSAKRIWQMAVAAACVGAFVFIAPILKNRKHSKVLASNISSLVAPKKGLADSLVSAATKDGPDNASVIFPPANTAFIEATSLNGNRVKIPARLAPLVPFINSGAVVPDKDGSGQSSAQNKILQQKIVLWKAAVKAGNSLPAAINFADPIDLLRFLQPKK